MRIGHARVLFEDFAARLRNWETTVPARAIAFRAARADLAEQVARALPFWKLSIGDEVVERFRDRVERLEAIADPLALLIQSAMTREAEVETLANHADSNDSELASWIENQKREWLVTLSRLGARCERDSDLPNDQKALADTVVNVRLLEEAIDLLREAGRVTKALPAGMDAALLMSMLPQFRSRLLREGATPEWLNEMRSLLQPLTALAARVQDPPAELGDFETILREARGWSKLLPEFIDETEQLRMRGLERIDWSAAQIQELLDAATGLRQRLIDQALEVRRKKLELLEEQMNDLRRAAGRQGDLERLFAALRQSVPNAPLAFEEWLQDFGKIQSNFKAIAYLHGTELDSGLRAMVAKLEKKVAELTNRSLSQEVSDAAVLIKRDLSRPMPSDAEDILRRLRELDALDRRLDELVRQADSDDRELDTRVRELTSRSQSVQAAAQRMKRVTLASAALPAKRIASLSKPAVGASLASRQKLVDDVAAELHAVELTFVEGCRAEFARELARVQHATDILQLAGIVPSVGVPLAIPGGASPHTAAQAVIEAAKRFQLLSRQGREILEEQEARAAEIRSALSALPANELTPGDRQTAERLGKDLDDVFAQQKQQLFDRLDQVAKRVRESDRFIAQLHQEEQSARERLAVLRRRLQDFHQDRLESYCPELTERVEALVYGVPKEPRRWSAVHHQLDVAADLFGRVETHARRLAADELAHAEQALRKFLRGAPDPTSGSSAQALLAELQACSPDVLPSAALRARVVEASQGRT
jgi:hypothetical protein